MLPLAIRGIDICARNQLLQHRYHGLFSQLWRFRALARTSPLTLNGYDIRKDNDCIKGGISSRCFCLIRSLDVANADAEGREGVGNEGADKREIDSVLEWIKMLQKPAVLAFAIWVLFSQEPELAIASNGGRIGGSRLSSDISFPAVYRSYSVSRSSIAIPASYAAPPPLVGGSIGDIFLGPLFGLSLGRGGFFFTLVFGFLMLQWTTGFLTDGASTEFVTQAQKTTILKLQIGLLGMARSLQSELETLVDGLDSPTAQSPHKFLAGTVQALIKHPDFCISAASSSELKRTFSVAKDRFDELCLEETGRFDEESAISMNNLRRRIISRPRSDRFNEYIVATLLVVAEGDVKLPLINGSADLMEALGRLGAIPEDQLLAAEVLWTPQDFNDYLSENELLRDYPLMRFL